MGAAESINAGTGTDSIYRTECERCCCITRFYRMSQSTRRDQWSGFALVALHAHNRLRNKHGASQLVLNMRLCKMAYSQARFLADNEIFEHSDKEERRHADGFCGENLAEAIIWHDAYNRPSGEDVTVMWYDEGKTYDYSDPKFNPDCAQFTQLVWQKTKMMGIAFAEYEPSDARGFVKTVVVANYYPCGNVENKYAENVQEPLVTTNIDTHTQLQRKIDQYHRKKARRGNRYTLLGSKTKSSHTGNLGL